MPTYEYVCKKCGEHLEVVQSFKDDALTVCPNCDGELKKVFGNIGIVFKGSGFYKTDSRKGSSPSPVKADTGPVPETAAKKETTSTGSEAKSDAAKPAAKEATPGSSSKSPSAGSSAAAS